MKERFSKFYILFFAILLWVLVFFIYISYARPTQEPSNIPKTYSQLVESFTPSTVTGLEGDMNNKKEVVYFLGKEKCPYCLAALNTLEPLSTTYQTEIKYIDMAQVPKESADYQKLQGLLGEGVLDDSKIVYVPMLFNLKDGKVDGFHVGTLEDDNTGKLTSTQKVELERIYKEILK